MDRPAKSLDLNIIEKAWNILRAVFTRLGGRLSMSPIVITGVAILRFFETRVWSRDNRSRFMSFIIACVGRAKKSWRMVFLYFCVVENFHGCFKRWYPTQLQSISTFSPVTLPCFCLVVLLFLLLPLPFYAISHDEYIYLPYSTHTFPLNSQLHPSFLIPLHIQR